MPKPKARNNIKSTPYPKVGLWKVKPWTSFRVETSSDIVGYSYVETKHSEDYALVFEMRGDEMWRALIKGKIVLIDKNTFWDMTFIPCDGEGQ